LWKKGTAAFRLLPFIDQDHLITQELAGKKDDGDIKAKKSPRAGRTNQASDMSNSDSDSDSDSAAHVSTDANSEIDDGR
jgi:hypothetical protein